MLVFIEFLRAIATLLILNSHLKGVYPTDFLSFGGGLGLALFYMLSGYLISNINENTKFVKWYFKKLLRLYVPLFLFRGFLVVVGYIKITSIMDFVRNFIFPTYWFVASMVIFYAIYYLFVKFIYRKFGKKAIIGTWIFCGLSFTVLYATQSPVGLFSLENLEFMEVFSLETPYIISQFIWFSAMLVGLYVKEFLVMLEEPEKKNYLNLINAILCVLLFLAVRIFELVDIDLEFLLSISYVGFAYFLFRFFIGLENLLKGIQKKIYFKPIKIISMCSLEIFYVQFIWISLFKSIVFPLNILLLVAGTVFTGFILHKISNKVLSIKKQ